MSISDEKISKSSALDIADAGEIAEKPIDIPEPQEITRFNKMREYRIKNAVDTQNRINTLLQKLESEKTDRLIQLYTQQLADAKRILRIQESYVEFMRIFKNINESDMVKKCYEGLFVLEQKNLGKIQTTDDMKQNRSTIHRLQDYAKKSGNQKLIDHALKLSKYL